MKTDAKIKLDVQDELAWEPSIDETKIGVAVDEGVVTLSGEVDSHSKKLAAEKAAKRVSGVKAVAEDIVVKYPSSLDKSDTEIAKAAVDALEWHSSVPNDSVIVKVENGWVSLSGAVKWAYQKYSATNAVKDLVGVKGVSNSISIKQDVKPILVKDTIEEAFERSARIDAKGIMVSTDGNTVTLSGKVNSIKEKEEAEKAAFRAPGVLHVVNKLKVQYYPTYA
ncbi:Osmotically-inducible protein OsmY, contains BON domain [Maribacter orientalis]|uniref:Osmotically-inducible protein OsmY, contains BON domain n=1 Tax=Maribacter orientalis TaxID=228957 RepID=A0A1H7NV98_9FLAO|nr:BON domain-containing protein [Maribacter orientalis]SEL27431.1 Osmotically-inducible protein OsmY, contains BON domain [Maribacter orientalis]|tara:strand:- start:558 stop:1226 length:669 start_codon:yes stop_codon:yes gene_type:complete